MNIIEKSESIRAGLRKGFQDGTSKMAQRKCYGYSIGVDGELVINSEEAAVVRWIFDRYLNGDSLGKIATGLEEQGISSPKVSPSGIERLSINCCLTKSIQAGCCSRKPSALVVLKSKTMALWSGIFIPIPMRPLFLMRYLGMPSRRNCNVQISQKKNLLFNYSFDSTKLSNACCDTYGTGKFISAFKSHFYTRIMFRSFYYIFLKLVW